VNPKCPRRIGFKCPYFDSEHVAHAFVQNDEGPISHRIVRKGFYRRSSDSKLIPRFYCVSCRRSFSSSFFFPCYRQKKRRKNEPIRKLLCSGVSQRRIARLLNVDRKTVARKLLCLASQAKERHRALLDSLASSEHKISRLHFDEMETFERSKCLPVSIPLAVEAKTRLILGYGVCSMPAKGPLARISLRKYGPRADDRESTAHDLFLGLARVVHPKAELTTDQNPKYPSWIGHHFPEFRHEAVKGRRGCVVGQGELKKIGFDPLFDLNHTCAMFRANVNRLFRRTWCTTKRLDRLDAHLAIYLQYHNEELI